MHQEFEAPAEIHDTIKCFWYDRRDVGEQPTPFEVQPDGFAEIIFYFGSLYHSGHQEVPVAIILAVYDGAAEPACCILHEEPFSDHRNPLLSPEGIRLLGLQPGKDGVRILEHPGLLYATATLIVLAAVCMYARFIKKA